MYRQLFITLILVLTSTIYSTAQALAYNPQTETTTTIASFENVIFFSDTENGFYYVDFEATNTQITNLTLVKQEEAIFTEDVSALPTNVIYEIDIKKLKPGTYTIELITIDKDKIMQEFDIKAKPTSVAGKGEE